MCDISPVSLLHLAGLQSIIYFNPSKRQSTTFSSLPPSSPPIDQTEPFKVSYVIWVQLCPHSSPSCIAFFSTFLNFFLNLFFLFFFYHFEYSHFYFFRSLNFMSIFKHFKGCRDRGISRHLVVSYRSPL